MLLSPGSCLRERGLLWLVLAKRHGRMGMRSHDNPHERTLMHVDIVPLSRSGLDSLQWLGAVLNEVPMGCPVWLQSRVRDRGLLYSHTQPATARMETSRSSRHAEHHPPTARVLPDNSRCRRAGPQTKPSSPTRLYGMGHPSTPTARPAGTWGFLSRQGLRVVVQAGWPEPGGHVAA